MNKVRSFEDLEVWKKAHQFVVGLYKIIEHLLKSEDYNIKSQLKRAAISIPTNIAEGTGRNTLKEYIQHLLIARGSCEECKYLLLLSKDLEFIDTNTHELMRSKTIEIGKMLNGLINSLRNSKPNS